MNPPSPFFLSGMGEAPFGRTNLPGRESFGRPIHPIVAALLQQLLQQPKAIIRHAPIPAHAGQYADYRAAFLQRFLDSPHSGRFDPVDPIG